MKKSVADMGDDIHTVTTRREHVLAFTLEFLRLKKAEEEGLQQASVEEALEEEPEPHAITPALPFDRALSRALITSGVMPADALARAAPRPLPYTRSFLKS